MVIESGRWPAPFLILSVLLALATSVCADDSQLLLRLDKEFIAHRSAGRYVEAELVGRQMLQIAERSFPHSPQLRATCIDNLGVLYCDQGRYAEAEPLHKWALATREKVFGPEHAQVAFSLFNLAQVYLFQERYPEAEPLQKRALSIREKVHGPQHPEVASSLCGLAGLFVLQHRYAEAESLAKRALAIYERVRGGDHADLVPTLLILGRSYVGQARFDEADMQLNRALAISETTDSPSKPELLYSSLGHLASAHILQRRYDESELYLVRALEIQKQLSVLHQAFLGLFIEELATAYSVEGRDADANRVRHGILESQQTAFAANLGARSEAYLELERQVKQGIAHLDTGRLAEAEQVGTQALELAEKGFSDVPVFSARPLQILASTYTLEGRYLDAGPLIKRCLDIAEKDFQTLNMAEYFVKIAGLQFNQGQHFEAELTVKRCLNLCETRLGSEHMAVAVMLQMLAVFYIYNGQGRFEDAELFCRRALDITQKIDGQEALRLAANNFMLLAHALSQQRRDSEAEAMFKQALESNEKLTGPYKKIGVSLSHQQLGVFYASRGRFNEAEPHLELARSFEGQAFQGYDGSQVPMSLVLMIYLRESQERLDEARELRDSWFDKYEARATTPARTWAHHQRAKLR